MSNKNDGKAGPLDNNSGFRSVSNKLDSALGATYQDPKGSMTRAAVHGAYHEIQHQRTGNPREHERAKDQWNSGFGGPTDNLKKWDAANGYKSDKKWTNTNLNVIQITLIFFIFVSSFLLLQVVI